MLISDGPISNLCCIQLPVIWQCTWASEGFFPGGPLADVSKFFLGGSKVVKFVFPSGNQENNLFMLKLSNSRGDQGPPVSPSDAHDNVMLMPWTVWWQKQCLATVKNKCSMIVTWAVAYFLAHATTTKKVLRCPTENAKRPTIEPRPTVCRQLP